MDTNPLKQEVMNKRIIYTLVLFVLSCILYSCESKDTDIQDIVAPGEIKNLTLKATSYGTITFSYDLPDDEDVYYVKIKYKVEDKIIERKASYLNDSIFVEGLPDTDIRTYQFVAGDRFGNESNAVEINAVCDTPPNLLAYNSSYTKADYGGGKICWTNKSKSWVYLNVIYNDENNVPLLQMFKSNLETDSISIGSMWDGEKSFSYYFTDRFGNISETKEAKVNALPAQLIPKNGMKPIYLDGDIPLWYSGADLFNDNIYERMLSNNYDISDFNIPHYITIDLGKEAVISKMILFGHPDQTYDHYKADLLKEFEVYGTDENLITGQDPKSVTWTLMIPELQWVPQFPALTSSENMMRGFTANSICFEKVRFLRVKLISRYVMTGGSHGNWYGRYCIGGEWTFLGSF